MQPDSLRPLMETLAPPVVAVVVAHDPGPWFEETLASLQTQDYAELSVLVLDDASQEGLTERVAAVLPSAYVRRFEENRGFGATVNEVPTMVDGADYYLLCHDDVALDPDAVHLMVEEAFRSNAGIVSPKEVTWDDPERLIHVGMTVDKGGSVVDRVQPYEIDHGQHDAVRDVFLAPGGCSLVRADLFKELGGFDPNIVAMGEDLDLCWRAQIVGARIIVAPDARVRHLENLASGMRPLDPALARRDGGDQVGDEQDQDRKKPPRHPVTLQELQRRHELLAVFKCYGPFNLIRVVPQVMVLALAEVIVAELAGNRARARAVTRAWRWNVGHLSVTRGQRKELASHRRLSDKEIRVLQVGGSARLSAYGRRVFQHGFHGAHADELAALDESAYVESAALIAAGAAAPDSLDVPEVVETRAGRLSGQVKLTTWLVAVLVVLIGTRGVIGARLPAVGQFAPFPSLSSTWTQFVTGWHPSGVGTTAPASPALAMIGVVGTVLFGAMGLSQKVLIFGCLPLGAWGVVRLLRPFGSQRASLVAGLAYLAMALAYNAIAQGRWGALVVYAGTPWAFGCLFRATRTAPYSHGQSHRDHDEARTATTPGTDSPGESAPGAPSASTRLVAWTDRHGTLRRVVALGLLEAVLISFVPAAAIVIVGAAVALLLSSCLFADWRGTWRAVRLAVGSTLVAALICAPWVIGVLSAGRGAVQVFGVPLPASSAASWSSLLRFAVGPIGVSPLAWGFAVAAALPLVLARGPRFVWAGRLWAIALVFWVLDWVMGRGWTGSLAIDPLVLLAPAAVAVAAAIGLGVAAFEEDLPSATFGWRQLLSVLAICVFVLGALPTLVSAVPGRWDLPVNDFSQSVTWMASKATSGSFRVLWLGDARALNQGSWAVGNGLAYATSEDGSPDVRWLWNAPAPGPTARLASAVNLAQAGRTDRLGTMLAPAGVRYVVLLTSLAPEIQGEQTPPVYPVPADLTAALSRQLDLEPVVSGTGITVYANAAWLPERALVPAGRSLATADAGRASVFARVHSNPASPLIPAAVPVLPGPTAARSYRGPLVGGTLLTALAPAGRWSLVEANGARAARGSAFGWAGRYAVTATGVGILRFDGGVLTPISFLASVIAWIAALAVLFRFGLGIPWRGLRRRRERARSRARGKDPEAAGPQPTTEDGSSREGVDAGVVA